MKLNINIYKVTFLLYQLLIFLNLFAVYLFRLRDCKKSFYLRPALDYSLFHPVGEMSTVICFILFSDLIQKSHGTKMVKILKNIL